MPAWPRRLDGADGIYFGDKDEVTGRTKHGKPGLASKRAVVGPVERGGEVGTFHVAQATAESIRLILRTNVSRKSRLYTGVGMEYAVTARSIIALAST